MHGDGYQDQRARSSADEVASQHSPPETRVNAAVGSYAPYRSNNQLTPKSGPIAPIAKQTKFAAMWRTPNSRLSQRTMAQLRALVEGPKQGLAQHPGQGSGPPALARGR